MSRELSLRGVVVVGVSLALALLMPVAAFAQTEAASGLTTPYPGVVIDAGKTASFELTVTGAAGRTLDLSIDGIPEGWSANFMGGSTVVDSVTVSADQETPTTVILEVDVPADAAEGTYEFTARAGSSTLPLSVTVQPGVSGSVTLTPDFPGLRGPTDAQFSFTVDVQNDTNATVELELEASGPEGWTVSAEPTGQAQAAAITIDAGQSTSVNLTAQAPLDAEAGLYDVSMTAAGDGVEAELTVQVELIGEVSLQVTTIDERLNAEVSTGGPTEVPIVVINDGTAALSNVSVSATPPSDWEVTFTPETITQLAPGESTTVTASVTPADGAIAGDYDVTFTASADTASDSMDIRTTVTPSALWGVIGVALIALTLAALAYVFRRFGRR